MPLRVLVLERVSSIRDAFGADNDDLSPLRRGFLDVLLDRWSLDHSPVFLAMDLMARLFSPYDLNPHGFNPLRQILAECVDFERIGRAPIKLFVCATNVRTGHGRVFRNREITPDVLLASACLPTMFQAVEIDGEPYWDGGYSGNPSMGPLIRECSASDTILIQINPIERPGTPRTAREIQNRLNEISFNATLLKDMKAAALLRQVADPGTGEGAKWAHMRVHRISSEMMLELGYSSKLLTEWPFFTMLRDEGRKAASHFLETHGADLGVRSTLDLDAVLHTIISRASQLAATEGGLIYEYDDVADQLRLRAVQNFEEELASALRARPLRKGEGVGGSVVETRAPFQVPDITAEGAYQVHTRDILVRAGYRDRGALIHHVALPDVRRLVVVLGTAIPGQPHAAAHRQRLHLRSLATKQPQKPMTCSTHGLPTADDRKETRPPLECHQPAISS
jgi:NTE family protein